MTSVPSGSASAAMRRAATSTIRRLRSSRRWGEGCCAGFNMETAPVDNSLCVGRKYLMAGKAVIHGVSAHSGNNYLAGRNAILEAAYKVIGIQALNDLEKGTHMNPAIVRGGTVMNAIPDSCELDFSGRFPTLAEVERVKEGLAKLFGESTIEGTHSEYTLSAARGGLEVTEEGSGCAGSWTASARKTAGPQWAKWCWAAARMPATSPKWAFRSCAAAASAANGTIPTGNMPWWSRCSSVPSSGQRLCWL